MFFARHFISMTAVLFLMLVLLPVSSHAEDKAKKKPATPQATAKFSRSQAYGDWVLNCADINKGGKRIKEVCTLQGKVVSKQGAVLLQMIVGKFGQKGEIFATLKLPLGFDLHEGVTWKVDAKQARKVRLRTCLQNGCTAELKMNGAITGELFKGNRLAITMLSGDLQKRLNFSLSLKGFTKGYKAIK